MTPLEVAVLYLILVAMFILVFAVAVRIVDRENGKEDDAR